MRISNEQKKAILDTISSFSGGKEFIIYLYGSRTDDSKKGGDIDLLVVVPQSLVDFVAKAHLKILVELKKHQSIGQRLIDIKFCTEEQLLTDPFLNSINKSLVKLG